jgi:glutathione S-transferase
MKLIIGNKNYSSWSLRGWLAAKQSGLSFEEITVPMFGKQWDALKSEDGGTQPSHGKVPILWDDEAVVWDSLAILEYLADKVGRDRFWPKDAVARGMARSMVAEMHSSYHALRGECPMNVRKRFEGFTPSEAVGRGAQPLRQRRPVPVRHFRRGGCLFRPGSVTLHQLSDRRTRLRRRLYAGGVGA